MSHVIEFYKGGARVAIAEHLGPMGRMKLETVAALRSQGADYAIIIDMETFLETRMTLGDDLSGTSQSSETQA